MPAGRGLIRLLLLLAALPWAAGATVAVLGDSLTAGYGVTEAEAWPARLEARLAETHPGWRVINAGVSGDTTAGGLRRLKRLLDRRPDRLVVALGANDGLRGLDPRRTEANLDEILRSARQAGVPAALCGMRLPPSLGEAATAPFAAVFPALAERHRIPFLPFLLDGVAGRPELNLADGIHPDVEGHRIIAGRMHAFLAPWLTDGAAAPSPHP